MIGGLFFVGGLGAAVAGWLLLKRYDRPAASLTVHENGKAVKPFAGPLETGSLAGVAAGYVLLLFGLCGAIVGGAVSFLR